MSLGLHTYLRYVVQEKGNRIIYVSTGDSDTIKNVRYFLISNDNHPSVYKNPPRWVVLIYSPLFQWEGTNG